MGERWSIFDRVTVGTIIGAGVVEAAQQALKDADQVKAAMPFLNLSGTWNYVPLALLTVGALSWVVKQLVASQRSVAATPSAVAPSDRVFVGKEVTESVFLKVYAEHTNVQGKQRAAVYRNKWIKIAGEFQDFDDSHGSYTVSLKKVAMTWFIYIRKTEASKIETMQMGRKIGFAARIDDVTRYAVWLRDAELLPDSELSDALWVSPEPSATKPRAPRKRVTPAPPAP